MSRSARIPLPEAFVSRVRKQFPDGGDALLEALDGEPSASVLLHPVKHGSLFRDLPSPRWTASSRILAERPVFTLDPHYHAGAYYPQESSSTFIHWLLGQAYGLSRPARALDLCAAPGGKTLLLQSWIGQQGLLSSNEIHPGRWRILAENVIRWGIPNILLHQLDPGDIGTSGERFDLILVDAPCSGEGMFRKDPRARQEWSAAHVDACAVRQKSILEQILPALSSGGRLLYSTCTFSPQENEGICTWLASRGLIPESYPVPAECGAEAVQFGEGYGYRLLPGRVPGEGFFCALFRKDAEDPQSSPANVHHPKQRSFTEPSTRGITALWPAISNLAQDGQGQVYASPLPHEALSILHTRLQVKMAGIPVGNIVKQDFFPAHGLAMIPGSHYPNRHHTSLQEALAYLKGEALRSDLPKEMYLVEFESSVLGWARAVPGRLNNLLPKELRIRMRIE